MKKLFLAALVLIVATMAQAANVNVLTSPTFRFWNSTGTAVLSGGYVVTCPAGTSCSCTSFTAKTTYTSSTGLVANSDPVYLNARGEADIWLDTQNGAYKITVCDRYGVLQKTTDGVFALAAAGGTSSSLSVWQPFPFIPSYINSTQFSVPGDSTTTFTFGRRLQFTEGAGTTYASVVTSAFTTSVTTVTVLNDSTILDSGLSAVNVSILDNKTGFGTSGPIYTSNTISTSGAIISSGTNTWTGSNQFSGITSSGTITSNLAGNVTGNLTGNISGNVTGNVTGNVSGSSGSCTGNSATATNSTNATNASYLLYSGGYRSAVETNTANSIVARDASGNFSAGTVTATLSGTASNANTFNGKSQGDVADQIPTIKYSGSFTGLSIAPGVNDIGATGGAGTLTYRTNAVGVFFWTDLGGELYAWNVQGVTLTNINIYYKTF